MGAFFRPLHACAVKLTNSGCWPGVDYETLHVPGYRKESFIRVERKTYYNRTQSEGKMPISLYRLASGKTIQSLRHNPK